jgi:virginiamycin B lyase
MHHMILHGRLFQSVQSIVAASLLCCVFSSPVRSTASAQAENPTKASATGVADPAVGRQMREVHPDATLHLPPNPDWFTATEDAVWVTSSRSNAVTQIIARTNQTGLSVKVARPCSGLSYGFGSIWIPSCGRKKLIRADAMTGKIIAVIAAPPAQSEGGITSGAGSVWLVTSQEGVLARIDPATNKIAATIAIPSGSYNPLFVDGYIWVTSNEHSELVQVDPATNRVIATIPTGRNPRFLTCGEGSVWTLNQGDGTISRIDTRTARVLANIEAGIPGHGGEITFGFHSAWATLTGFPITRVDATTNKVTEQWVGEGGDSIRFAHGSLWLTNYRTGQVWRITPAH